MDPSPPARRSALLAADAVVRDDGAGVPVLFAEVEVGKHRVEVLAEAVAPSDGNEETPFFNGFAVAAPGRGATGAAPWKAGTKGARP